MSSGTSTPQIQTPTGTSVSMISSAAMLSDCVKKSMERAQTLTIQLKRDSRRDHICKQKMWRKFVERELHELKDSLRNAPLSGNELKAAHNYMHALERSQSGTALRSHSWQQRLIHVVMTGSHTQFAVTP